MDTKTIRIADASVLGMVEAAEELWELTSVGIQDPYQVFGKASQQFTGLKEQLLREELFGVMNARTPSLEQVQALYREFASHIGGISSEARHEFTVLRRRLDRASDEVDQLAEAQSIIRRRGDMLAGITWLQDHLGDDGADNARVGLSQAFVEQAQALRSDTPNPKHLAQLEQLVGAAHLAQLDTIFALNRALPRASKMELPRVARNSGFKYGQVYEIVDTPIGPVANVRCQYELDALHCVCGTRPPQKGTEAVKVEQAKYEDIDFEAEARKVTLEATDRYMGIVYVGPNCIRGGLLMGPFRVGAEFLNEFQWGMSLALAGSVGELGRQRGRDFVREDRRVDKAVRHMCKQFDTAPPKSNVDLWAALHDMRHPINAFLTPDETRKIARHASADILNWISVLCVTIGVQWRACMNRALQSRVDEFNADPRRRFDLAFEPFVVE